MFIFNFAARFFRLIFSQDRNCYLEFRILQITKISEKNFFEIVLDLIERLKQEKLILTFQDLERYILTGNCKKFK